MKKILKKILKKLGLLKWYRHFKGFIGRASINKELERLLKNIEDYQRQSDKKLILITGHILLEKKRPFLKLLKSIAAQMPEVEFVILDEARVDEHEFDIQGIKRFEIPNVYRNAGYIFRDEEKIEEIFQEKDYLFQSLQNMVMRGRPRFFSQNLLYVYDMIYTCAAKYLDPDLILLWSKFSAVHSTCDAVFKENNITVNYLEYGSLPGTYGIENFGQMGESFPAREYQKFLNLPVDEEEIQQADEVWYYLHKSGLNRNSQVQDDVVEQVKVNMKEDWSVILFAGNLDYDSGIVPYTLQSQTYHSPMFQTSEQALNYLAVLAEKNHWNLVFKPHPSIANKYNRYKLPRNVIYIPRGNLNDLIDFADVVVTIMSQTAYVSCIRKRPAVMLGYNQLRGKGCVYEAYQMEHIDNVINSAIEKGFTQKQQEAFRTHIAQMCKYYLYDDQSNKEINYGQNVERAVEYLRGEIESTSGKEF